MVASLRQLWKSFASAETVEGGAEAAKAVFELAETLNKQKDKNPQIKELVERIPTLLDALNSPLGQVIESSVPFLPIATGIIKFAIEANHFTSDKNAGIERTISRKGNLEGAEGV